MRTSYSLVKILSIAVISLSASAADLPSGASKEIAEHWTPNPLRVRRDAPATPPRSGIELTGKPKTADSPDSVASSVSIDSGSSGSPDRPAYIFKNPMLGSMSESKAGRVPDAVAIDVGGDVADAKKTPSRARRDHVAVDVAERVATDHYDAKRALVDQFMQKLFDPRWSRADVAKAIATLVLTGGLAYEIRGEVQRMTDQTTFVMAQTEMGFRYLYFDPEGSTLTEKLKTALTVNDSIFLSPYIPQRLAQFYVDFTSAISRPLHRLLGKKCVPTTCAEETLRVLDTEAGAHRVESHRSIIAEALGLAFVTGAAVATGFSPAYALYKNNIGFANTAEIAMTLPAFVGLFYSMDAYARLSALRDRVFTKIFNRNDPVADQRMALIEKIREAKRQVFRMDDAALLRLHTLLTGLSTAEKSGSGLTQLRELTTLGATTAPVTKPTFWQKAKSALPWVAGGVIAAGAAYLTYQQTYAGMGDAYRYFTTGEASDSDSFKFWKMQYQIFQKDTSSLALADWFTQCVSSQIYSEGNSTAGGIFTFSGCKGVLLTDEWGSSPGDMDMSMASAWYNFIDGNYAGLAGITNDNNGGEGVTGADDYVLPTGGNVFAHSMASLAGIASYALNTLHTQKFIRQIRDTFSENPNEVLPGRKSMVLNGVVMTAALVQSILRASPVAVGGFVALDGTISPSLMYTVLGLSTLSQASSFFDDFSGAYSAVPRYAERAWGFATGALNSVTSRFGVTLSEPVNVLTKRDETLIACDKLLKMLANADVDTIIALNRVGIA